AMEKTPDENQNSATETNEPEGDSLEALPTTTDGSPSAVSEDTPVAGNDGVLDATSGSSADTPQDGKKKKRSAKGFLAKFNVYLLLFVFLIVIAGVVTAISVIKSRQISKTEDNQVKTEPLSQEALEQLRQTDVKVGDPKQILSVESNAIFAGRVLIRGGLEVAGEIKAGAPLNIPGTTVSGNSVFGQVQANELQVAGNTTIQGQLAIQNNLSVTGSGTFGGALTAASLNIQNLQINGDLQLARHIDAGGGTPGKSDGSALGAGGTSSVSGTDTAGTVAINTGGGPPAGCFVTINFAQRFNGTPHVVITPVGSVAGSLNYYINRTGTSFSVCTANPPPAGQSFAFDYIAID
ncbi:MAG: hypothetical protein ACR2FM_00255, partial [Candidatus Saccharimonadales bacterium]